MSGFTVGRARVDVIEDGSFFMAPDFLSGAVDPGSEERDAAGRTRLPVQAFLVRGERTVLIDAGLGPDPESALEAVAAQVGLERRRMGLVGDAGLGPRLRAHGISFDAIDAVVVSHLHLDHTGWLIAADGSLPFGKARVLIPRADFDHYVTGGRPETPAALAEGLRALVRSGRIELFEGEMSVSADITALPAPGHTPGHTVFAIADGQERAMILGDAMYCPMQLGQLDVGALHDVDPALARRTRELIARDAEAHLTRAVGCHFAGGRSARLVDGRVTIG